MKLCEAHMKTSAAKTIGRKAIYTVLVLSALLPFVGLHGAEAGVNAWTSNGPRIGHVLALAIDPRTPATLYASTSIGASNCSEISRSQPVRPAAAVPGPRRSSCFR